MLVGCLLACLFACLFDCLLVDLFGWLVVLSVCLFICLLVCLLACLFVCLFVGLFRLFVCLFVCLLVGWLFVCLLVLLVFLFALFLNYKNIFTRKEFLPVSVCWFVGFVPESSRTKNPTKRKQTRVLCLLLCWMVGLVWLVGLFVGLLVWSQSCLFACLSRKQTSRQNMFFLFF